VPYKAHTVVKHIVFLKLSKRALQNTDTIKQKLLNLKEQIPYIVSLEVGLNFCDQSRAYDISLVVVFDTRDDLLDYSTDIKHLELVEYLTQQGTTSVVVDYEI
jgi:hypothetical protein